MKLKEFIRNCTFGEYSILYRQSDEDNLLIDGGKHRFNVLHPNEEYWYADPILYTESDETFVFMEMFDKRKEKGMIGISVFNDKGELERPIPVLEEDFHLSFPMVFDYNDETFMIPETSEVNELRIYKKVNDIYHWQLVRCFKDIGSLVDTIVYPTENGLFLFSAELENGNLFKSFPRFFYLNNVFYDDLKEVSMFSDNVHSNYKWRSAGKVININNKIYRIAQESTETEYGVDIIVNEINRWQVNEYSESELIKITVDNIEFPMLPIIWKKKGIHTYGYENGHEVADIFIGKVKGLRKLQ